ncbi:MAG: hypothetical protein QM778_18070 [Myxococcales bacterium]
MLRSRPIRILLPALVLGACAQDPWTYPSRESMSVGSEVFRVFCKRVASADHPEDLEGTQFNAACLGQEELADPSPHLGALLERRPKVVSTVDRILGESTVTQPKFVNTLETDELRNFLKDIIPLYDAPEERLPKSTRVLSAVAERLIDGKDKTGQKALTALSEITGRSGYRKLELALGLVRPLLEYPELDTFAENGLRAIARGGVAEKSLDEISLGLAAELANYSPDPPAPDSTLLVARDLLLSPILQNDQPEREPIFITRRDKRGVALPFGAPEELRLPFADDDGDGLADVDKFGRFVTHGEPKIIPSPYPIASESKVQRDASGHALNVWTTSTELSEGDPLYSYFDAQPTLIGALVRETSRLTVPAKEGDRTSLEKLGRGLQVLFGLNSPRKSKYGKLELEFTGPNPESGAAYDLIHAVGAAARANPDAVRRFLQLFARAMQEREHEMTSFVDMALRINDRGKMHEEAVLVGDQGPGMPHRFWDDLIAIIVRASNRPGLMEGLIRWITLPETQAAGQIFADWMQYADPAKYKGADFTPSEANGTFKAPEQVDMLNAQVEVNYKTEPDRSQPSVGKNRSVWQQTMSMVHNLRQPICNKDGTVLHLVLSCERQPVACGIGAIRDYPWSGSYKKCELFEIQHMVRIWSQAILGKAEIVHKPEDFRTGIYTVFGVDTFEVQELESQITGFNQHPTPGSFARFIYAPPNQFIQKMKPDVTIDGAKVEEVDPYALFAMEVKHKNANGMSFLEAGKPLVELFETHELTAPGKDSTGVDVPGGSLKDGYLLADLLNVFHMHWGSRTEEPCNGVPACTQHTDPKGKFFSYQTDIRSYEPLLVEILRDEKLIEVLAAATKALDSISIEGKNGVQILTEFAETMVKPQKDLTYRDGTMSAKNNVGEDVGYVSPLYLFLDGLKRMDQNFAAPEMADRVDAWREARSEIVDLFLTVEDLDGKKRLKDRIGWSIFIKALGFLQDRIKVHQDAKDIDEWAVSLAPRAATFFDTPLIAGLLHLFDQSWDEPAAGRELMRFITYVVDEQKNAVGFETTLVALADLLQLLEDSPRIAPLLDLAAEAATPGVSQSIEGTGGKDFDPDKGLLRSLVELTNTLLKVHTRRPSTLQRVAHNLVATDRAEDQTPLEALIDFISEVERVDPTKPSSAPLDRDDLETVANSLHSFMADDGHGLERLYDVIQNRVISPSKAQE